MRFLRRSPAKTDASPVDQWFADHVRAAGEVIDFCAEAGLSLSGLALGDVGAGDGIIDLAIALRAQPSSLIGWDVIPVDEVALLTRAQAAGLCAELPSNLRFVQSAQTGLSADDASVDGVLTWSAYEHIGDIRALSGEIARVLRPGGFVFAQVWPLYYSERGSHLEEWWPDGFHHLIESPDVLRSRLDTSDADPGWCDYMWTEYQHLNKARLDDVQRAFLGVGLITRRCELYSHLVNIPESVAKNYQLSDLMITGFKMLLTHAGS